MSVPRVDPDYLQIITTIPTELQQKILISNIHELTEKKLKIIGLPTLSKLIYFISYKVHYTIYLSHELMYLEIHFGGANQHVVLETPHHQILSLLPDLRLLPFNLLTIDESILDPPSGKLEKIITSLIELNPNDVALTGLAKTTNLNYDWLDKVTIINNLEITLIDLLISKLALFHGLKKVTVEVFEELDHLSTLERLIDTMKTHTGSNTNDILSVSTKCPACNILTREKAPVIDTPLPTSNVQVKFHTITPNTITNELVDFFTIKHPNLNFLVSSIHDEVTENFIKLSKQAIFRECRIILNSLTNDHNLKFFLKNVDLIQISLLVPDLRDIKIVSNTIKELEVSSDSIINCDFKELTNLKLIEFGGFDGIVDQYSFISLSNFVTHVKFFGMPPPSSPLINSSNSTRTSTSSSSSTTSSIKSSGENLYYKLPKLIKSLHIQSKSLQYIDFNNRPFLQELKLQGLTDLKFNDILWTQIPTSIQTLTFVSDDDKEGKLFEATVSPAFKNLNIKLDLDFDTAVFINIEGKKGADKYWNNKRRPLKVLKDIEDCIMINIPSKETKVNFVGDGRIECVFVVNKNIVDQIECYFEFNGDKYVQSLGDVDDIVYFTLLPLTSKGRRQERED